jgi:hypothetical protein
LKPHQRSASIGRGQRRNGPGAAALSPARAVEDGHGAGNPRAQSPIALSIPQPRPGAPLPRHPIGASLERGANRAAPPGCGGAIDDGAPGPRRDHGSRGRGLPWRPREAVVPTGSRSPGAVRPAPRRSMRPTRAPATSLAAIDAAVVRSAGREQMSWLPRSGPTRPGARELQPPGAIAARRARSRPALRTLGLAGRARTGGSVGQLEICTNPGTGSDSLAKRANFPGTLGFRLALACAAARRVPR